MARMVERALREASRYRHRLVHTERSVMMPVALRTLSQGDVFVRSGTPHMVGRLYLRDPDSSPDEPSSSLTDQVWVVNLTTGSVFKLPGWEEVHPAEDVRLDFRTSRPQ